MSTMASKSSAPAVFQKTIRLGDVCLHLATASRSIDIHGERRATDSSLQAFCFVGEVDEVPSPRRGREPSPSAPTTHVTWYYSPLADFEKKRLRVEESVVAAAVSAAINLCAAANTKLSDIARSPKLPQVYVRVGNTSTFRKYEYAAAASPEAAEATPQMESPAPHAITSPPSSAQADTPPRLRDRTHTATAKQLNLSLSPDSSTRSPEPRRSLVSPLADCGGTVTSPLRLPVSSSPRNEDEDCSPARSANVAVDVRCSLNNGFQACTPMSTYAEAGLMELPQHPPRQQRHRVSSGDVAIGASASAKPISPLRSRITPLMNGRVVRRNSGTYPRQVDASGSSVRLVSTPLGAHDVSAFAGKAITLSPGGSSTPFLSCSMVRTGSFQLSTSITTLGNVSGSTTHGWITNADEGLCESTEQRTRLTTSPPTQTQTGQPTLQPHRPRRPCSPRTSGPQDSDAPLPPRVLLTPSMPCEGRPLRRHQRPGAAAQNDGSVSTLPCGVE